MALLKPSGKVLTVVIGPGLPSNSSEFFIIWRVIGICSISVMHWIVLKHLSLWEEWYLIQYLALHCWYIVMRSRKQNIRYLVANRTAFWDVIPCGLVDSYQHFRRMYSFHLPSRRWKDHIFEKCHNNLLDCMASHPWGQ
jgi:hypothetical protein